MEKKEYFRAFAFALGLMLAAIAGMGILKKCEDARVRGSEGARVRGLEDVRVERETIVVYDTAFIDIPVVRDSIVKRYVTVTLPRARECEDIRECGGEEAEEREREEVMVEIPITQKEYGDTTYRAWVSGYMANLDSIQIYGRRETVRETVLVNKRKRWGFTVGPAVGVGWTGRGPAPYVGVGLTWGYSF